MKCINDGALQRHGVNGNGDGDQLRNTVSVQTSHRAYPLSYQNNLITCTGRGACSVTYFLQKAAELVSSCTSPSTPALFICIADLELRQ